MPATAYIRSLTGLAATLVVAAGIVCHPIAHSSSGRAEHPVAEGCGKTKADRQDSSATASRSDQAIVVLVNDEPVTAYQIEQRARLLALNANISEQAKDNFQRLVKAESTTAQFRALQEEVIRTNQGKSREQLIAIFQERQKKLAMSLQKQAVDSARASVLPRLKKDAKEELIDERLKVQEAKRARHRSYRRRCQSA